MYSKLKKQSHSKIFRGSYNDVENYHSEKKKKTLMNTGTSGNRESSETVKQIKKFVKKKPGRSEIKLFEIFC